MPAKSVLAFTVMGEAATGLLLILFPAIVVRLLCGWEIGGSSLALSRFAGIALFSLAVACRPMDNFAQQLIGMLTYTVLATVFLTTLGITGNAGILLWPAAAIHALLGLTLGRAWRAERVNAFTK